MNNRPTILHLPGHLPYPITISSLLVKPDSTIRKHDGLLVYKFFAYESEEQDDQEEKPVRKERVEQFDSPWEGILTEWLVKEGTIVNSSKYAAPFSFCVDDSDPVVSVIEPCLHEISFKDICAICGTDLSVYLPRLLDLP
jgi:RNA polymerase II subunit A C-terminal domain phosphatase